MLSENTFLLQSLGFKYGALNESFNAISMKFTTLIYSLIKINGFVCWAILSISFQVFPQNL